jgi:hypothetical protein
MIKKLFTEAPYISYGDDNNKIFDLQIEDIINKEGILNYLEALLLGKSFRDKHGNIIQLKTRDEKINCIKQLKSDVMFNSLINKFLSSTEKRLLDILFHKFI